MANPSPFTLPNEGTNAQERPRGAGDNGETWDPIQKKWIPQSAMPAQPMQARAPDGAGFSQPIDPNNPNRTGEGQGPGHNRSEIAWGGYDGTYEPDGKGGFAVNYAKSGVGEDVDRYRNKAGAALGREAFQNDYSVADSFAGDGHRARNRQLQAAGFSRDVAQNGDAISQQLGRNMLKQGEQMQQAGALSTRGGPLAAASALQRQQGGVAAYNQTGNLALQAQRADDMARGRSEYADQLAAVRGLDSKAQGLNQEQAVQQGNNELEQRSANDTMEGSYEGLAYNTLATDVGSELKRQQTKSSIFGNQLQVGLSETQGRNELINSGLTTIDSAVPGGKPSGDKPSDERCKNVADLYGKKKRR